MNDTVTYPIHFKHKQIRAFKVGEFRFNNNVCAIPDANAHARFMALYDRLPGPDRANIVQLLHIENEKPVGSMRIDGSSSSDKILDGAAKALKETQTATPTPAAEPAAEPAQEPATPAVPAGLKGLQLGKPSTT